MRYVFALLLLLTYSFGAPAATQWETLAPGLSYTTLHPGNQPASQQIHAFRIDLARYRLNLMLAKAQQRDNLYVSRLATKTHALIAINGGFFEPNFEPLGLRIQDQQVLNPIKPISWWGVFFVKNNRASISSKKTFRHEGGISFAVQAGPRLIVDGQTLRLKSGEAQRSALGINQKGEVILLVTENWMLSLNHLARIMQRSENENGLSCQDALNLDGGTSSQIYARIGSFILNVPSLRGVSDAIFVTAKF